MAQSEPPESSQATLLRRLVIPAGTVFVFWLALNFIYDRLIFIEDVETYALMADITWVLLVVCIGFGTLFIYPIMTARGASFVERVIGCLLTPVGWCVKEFLRVNVSFTLGESFFYAFFTSVSLMLLFGQVGLIGISELAYRWRARRRGQMVRILTPIPVTSIVVSLGVVYFIGLYDGGYAFHLTVKMVYRALFL